MEARYRALRVGDALRRRSDYTRACKELVVLLKEVYSVAHKSLQTALFQDVIAAFRVLQDGSCCSVDMSAAHWLAQISEGVLPKHKKCLAASEYKEAAILWQRNSKRVQKQEDWIPLPADILIHVFSFLDGISLATAACVSRTWCAASKQDKLWQRNFVKITAATPFDPKVLLHARFKLGDHLEAPCKLRDISIEAEGCWKKAFELLILRSPRLLYLFSRAQCLTCKATFWPSELSLQQFNGEGCKKDQEHKLRPLLPQQVVSYVLVGSRSVYPTVSTQTGESDSDEDDYLPYAKLWEYAKCLR